MATRAEIYRKNKKSVCDVVESIFGKFNSDFISVKNRNEEEVRSYLKNGTESKGLDVAIDKYLYIAEVGSDVIIKR